MTWKQSLARGVPGGTLLYFALEGVINKDIYNICVALVGYVFLMFLHDALIKEKEKNAKNT